VMEPATQTDFCMAEGYTFREELQGESTASGLSQSAQS